MSAAAYDLGLLYLEGQLFPQDFARAAELFRAAAQAGNPEAQYALATLYKDGRGVPKDVGEAARLLGRGGARRQYRCRGRIRASRCSTAPASPRTKPRPPCCCARRRARAARSRRTGWPVILAIGRGAAGRSGAGDQMAPDRQGRRRRRPRARRVRARPEAEVRAAGEKAAQPWLEAIKPPRS